PHALWAYLLPVGTWSGTVFENDPLHIAGVVGPVSNRAAGRGHGRQGKPALVVPHADYRHVGLPGEWIAEVTPQQFIRVLDPTHGARTVLQDVCGRRPDLDGSALDRGQLRDIGLDEFRPIEPDTEERHSDREHAGQIFVWMRGDVTLHDADGVVVR